ncbi:MAG TPA: hypothetical protein RMF84_17820 [Polyangiaceae bacterium LLY-WYZ-14_1]|nr:hypothetical protein [Polyangiaceae bacterium LLY-WYZ-14_1]
MTGPSPSSPPASLRREAPRDQAESEFTPILRRLWARDETVLAVAFVDQEGECIDYCSSLDPFDAKIAGAHMLVVVAETAERLRALDGGETQRVSLLGDEREILVRRLSEDYALVVVAAPSTNHRQALHEGIEEAASALRQEAKIERPAWDLTAHSLHVQLRAAVGWPYAPLSYLERGRRVRVTEVLGRWVEAGGGSDGSTIEGFRVRTAMGEELTLVYDPDQDAWIRR